MTSTEQYERAVEAYTLLAALRHRKLLDGRIADHRAEGLLGIVKAWQESERPRLDVAGMALV